MCEFCKSGDITEICKKSIDFGILGEVELTIDISENYIYANFVKLDNSDLNVELKKHISFCPICGRKLNGE